MSPNSVISSNSSSYQFRASFESFLNFQFVLSLEFAVVALLIHLCVSAIQHCIIVILLFLVAFLFLHIFALFNLVLLVCRFFFFKLLQFILYVLDVNISLWLGFSLRRLVG